jgi:hypothetical protein
MSGREHFRAFGRQRMELGATLFDQEGNARSVTIRDLGLGGAGLELVELDLALDTRVVLELSTPTLWDPLRLPGTIAWVRPSQSAGRRARAGIRFEHHDASMLFSLFQVLQPDPQFV